MSWLHFFRPKPHCLKSFGRGINADIAKNEGELFNKAYEAFEKKEILNAYEFFFNSLMNYKNGISNENIILTKENETLKFIIYQGTAKVNGFTTNKKLYAEVTMVKAKSANVALKRYVLERNYQFTYINYCSDSNYIKLKLNLDNITMTPQKAFYPLRELALNADYDKEHMLSEFEQKELEDIQHIKKLDATELKVKYEFLHKWIDELNEKIHSLPSDDSIGMQSFLYLNFLFKIDYLIVPKCKIYQKLTKQLQDYFGDEEILPEVKNAELAKYILTLEKLNFDEFSLNFYKAKYTFSQIEKSSYDELINFIEESLIKLRWYKNNRHPQIIPTIYSYIALYALYNYGLNPPARKLLHVYISVIYAEYFKALGCSGYYDTDKNKFLKSDIISQIENIISEYKHQYKLLKAFGDELDFSSLNDFSNSYFSALKNLNFHEA
ncbi:hypothetical protein [Sulfurimonas autotrophica]|uniref:Uncharacterized protein n=1 Tax=Sulfurimonas autotrophica (strain ATCC BAA-671 / DSM 16294 / JCM 11897 / OK10) TaxID=563040 RepID=E0UQH1_SULAO|nr:hypothetical protein [Sulfurimonas autotrophica]ADN08773.1 conserved hypothetical protein [Sulfurimonas autotrophica DSM 16294]